MFCVQTRVGRNTTMTCSDSSGISKYHLTEPAPLNSEAPYEEDQQLAPGLYQLLPRLTPGTALPKGSPVYTAPGQPIPGLIITPSGRIRGVPLPVGPHVGRRSEGCPLFAPTQAGEREKEKFYRAFKANVNIGGTWVFILDPFDVRRSFIDPPDLGTRIRFMGVPDLDPGRRFPDVR